MASQDIKRNIKNTNSWLRLLFIIIFLVFYGIAELVFWFAVLVQVLFTLFSGSVNKNVRSFSGKLAAYIYEVLRYVSYQTEQKPFPFSSWPEEQETDTADIVVEATVEDNSDDTGQK